MLLETTPTLTIHKRNGTVVTILLDPEDYEDARHISWCMRGGKGRVGQYAGNPKRGYLHRWVAQRMGLLTEETPKGAEVDHHNQNKLDCRRGNLRLARRVQNIANKPGLGGTSSFKGVSLDAKTGLWQAHIREDGASRFLGYYESEEDAARVYDAAARAEYGEFSHLNLPGRVGEELPERFSFKESVGRSIDLAPATTVKGKGRAGSRNGRAKLTEDDVRQIVVELQRVPRRTQADIAQQYGVAQTQISSIRHRRSWAHLWE
jgi:hypothetical protein